MRVAGRDTLPIRIGPAQQPNGQAKDMEVTTLAKQQPDALRASAETAVNVAGAEAHES